MTLGAVKGAALFAPGSMCCAIRAYCFVDPADDDGEEGIRMDAREAPQRYGKSAALAAWRGTA